MTSYPTVRFLDRSTPPHIITLILLAGVAALNMSIFLPSLTAMSLYFDTPYPVMQISISGYLAMTAVLQIFIGPISDKFGRRRVVLGSLTLFVIATIGAGLSTNIEMFLAFRMLQAVVASGFVLSRAIVRDMVPQDQAASMIGYVTMGMALVPMIGPMLGGALEEIFAWQASFVLLTSLGIGVLTLAYFDQGETLKSGGLSFSEQLRDYPALFASPRFWGYVLAATFGSGAFFALLGGASFVSTEVYGLSPLWGGIALGTPAFGYAMGNFLSGRYSVQVGINKMALIGAFVTLFGLSTSLILGLFGINHPMVFFGFCTFLGLGNGMLMPNVTAGMLSVRPHLAGTASGLGGAIMVGGGAALSQLAGAVLTVETGTLPLQGLMVFVSILALMSLLFVVWRERQISP